MRHPNTPQTIDRVGPINIFSTGRRVKNISPTADEIEHAALVSYRGRSIPNDVYPAVIAGIDPGEDVVVQNAVGRTRSIDCDRRAPGVSLVGRVGIFQDRVARDREIARRISSRSERRLFPNRIEISGFVDRQRRKVCASFLSRTEIGY